MNASPLSFRGLGTALVTPFCHDGSIDSKSLQHLVNYQIEGGADFLVVLGTTSEAPCLTEEEKSFVCQTVRETAGNRIPLVLGCGGNCTANVVETLQNTDLTGMTAILSVAPFYNKPNQEGLYQHFHAIAEASSLPVILYNVPSRTGVNISSETTLRLASDCANIVGIKEASGDLEQVRRILSEKPVEFSVLSGDDALTLAMMREGATGVISVIGNALPRQFKRMLTLHENGKETEAESINKQLDELYKLLFIDGNPAGIKALLHLMGYIDNVLRLPLTPMRLSMIERMMIQVHRLALV